MERWAHYSRKSPRWDQDPNVISPALPVQSKSNCPTLYITKTCPCKVYPLEPHFYIVKMGYAGVHLFFLFLLQNIDCGYSLEPPRRGGSYEYPQSMFRSKNKKNIQNFQLKIFQFLKLKNLCLLHGKVFVMSPAITHPTP